MVPELNPIQGQGFPVWGGWGEPPPHLTLVPPWRPVPPIRKILSPHARFCIGNPEEGGGQASMGGQGSDGGPPIPPILRNLAGVRGVSKIKCDKMCKKSLTLM